MLPSRLSDRPTSLEVRPMRPADDHDAGGSQLADVWGTLVRNWVLIGLTTVAVGAAAFIYVLLATPVYLAGTLLRIDEKEPNLPEVVRTTNPVGGTVATEMQVLRSRTLMVNAIQDLGLQVRLTKPRRVPRSLVLRDLVVSPDAPPQIFQLRRAPDGFRVQSRRPDLNGLPARIGERVRVGGISFVLAPTALEYGELEVVVQDFDATVQELSEALEVTQPGRDVNVVNVAYSDVDANIVWQIPNSIVAHFISSRNAAQKTEARSTVVFLRSQLDTLSRQLGTAEDELRRFREREGVVNPGQEATNQLGRLVDLQSQRGIMEAERAALAKLIDSLPTGKRTDSTQADYRDLVAFPSLLRNAAASDLLRSLTSLEDQRTELLVRRTPADPDVRALTDRIDQIQVQLRALATTYLQGLSNQVGSLDSVLEGFGQQLSQVPRRELEFARLERQPKVLEDMYALLQTRLKEAEIAQAVEDPSVRVVDLAVPPLMPFKPRKLRTVAAALAFGLLLGISGAFVRERLDRSVHSHSDIFAATGLPVVGLVPRLQERAKTLTFKKVMPSAPPPPPEPPKPTGPKRPRYTFFGAGEPDESEAPPAALPEPVIRPPVLIRQVSLRTLGAQWAEAYRSLQTNLIYAVPDGRPRTIVITSALPGEGKTTTAVNLALTLAERGVRTILLDGDLRRGAVHHALDCSREPGLSNVLRGQLPFEQAVHVLGVEEGVPLHVLPAGGVPPNPPGLLESPAMHALLSQLQGDYDAILIDSPPVNIITDAALLAAAVDGVLLVARAGVTQGNAMSYALHQLELVHANMLGVVLNDLDFRRDAIYDPTYRYYQNNPYTGSAAT